MVKSLCCFVGIGIYIIGLSKISSLFYSCLANLTNKIIILFYSYLQLLLYPEGTRLSDEKLKNSQKIAEEKGYTVLKHHLLPGPRVSPYLYRN